MTNKLTKEEALKKVRGYLTDYLPLEDADKIDEIIEAVELSVTPSYNSVNTELEQTSVIDKAYWTGMNWTYKFLIVENDIAYKTLPEPYKVESEDKEMTEEDKLYADELRKRAYSDYERLNMAIDELERQTCSTPRNNLEITSQELKHSDTN